MHGCAHVSSCCATEYTISFAYNVLDACNALGSRRLQVHLNAFTVQYSLKSHDHTFTLTTDQLSWQLSLALGLSLPFL